MPILPSCYNVPPLKLDINIDWKLLPLKFYSARGSVTPSEYKNREFYVRRPHSYLFKERDL
jgi:hypothetical protein